MSKLDHLGFFHKVFSPFERVSQLAMQGEFSEEDVTEFKPIEFKDIVEAFPGITPNSFLTKLPLLHRLNEFYEQKGRLRIMIPEGTQVTLAALPCDLAGMELTSDQWNDVICSRRTNASKHYPYLYTFLTDPSDPLFLTENLHGGIIPAPFLKLLPVEMVKYCSFVARYTPVQPGEAVTQQQKDYESIAYAYMLHYNNLGKLFFRRK